MKASRVCPICKRSLTEDAVAACYRPFCSKRCADIDLSRWFTGAYAVPAVEPDDDEDGAGDGEAKDGPAEGEAG
jgi:endogenous inhibitor of DNA gyrase (YacG/DUF329 family)